MMTELPEKGTQYGRVAGLILAVTGLLALMIAAFAWPTTSIGPREVPLVVAGPPRAVDAIVDRLSQVPGADVGTPAFEVTKVTDESAAEQAIRDREAYGAVVLSQQGPQLLVASAASPVLAQQLTQAVGELSAQLGGGQPGAPQQVAVRDVVPAPPDDPRGLGFGASVLPTVLISVAAGAAIWQLARTAAARLAGLIGLAAVAGLAASAVLQYGFGVFNGSYWGNALAVGVLVLAIAATVTGLGAVLGGPGVGLAAITIIFLGNPWSGSAAAPELLAQPWGEIGQYLPPGAGASLLRSVAFFDGAAATGPAWVLTVWAAAGLVLVGVGAAVKRRRPPAEADSEVTLSRVA